MQRMAAPILSIEGVTIGKEPDSTADVNIHLPWHSMIAHEGGKNIIVYTHCNPPDKAALITACQKADLITCMSHAGMRELDALGIDKKKIRVVYCSTDFKYRKRLIGIVGSVQPNGRKRESILVDLAWKYDLTPYEFLIVGNGWQETIKKLASLGVSVRFVENVDEAQMQAIYDVMDVLLVTGYVEGGSLPILEAMAVGVPVISPKYGYAADMLGNPYESPDSLMDALTNMFGELINNSAAIREWTWKDYANEYARLIQEVCNA